MSEMALVLNINDECIVTSLQEAAGSLDNREGEAVLDFSTVHRIDTAALRALQELARVADEKTVKVVLRGVTVDVYKVLKLVNLTRRFSFVN